MSFFCPPRGVLFHFAAHSYRLYKFFCEFSLFFCRPIAIFPCSLHLRNPAFSVEHNASPPHFLHVEKILPARIVYLHSCPPDGCDLFHEICIFSGRWGNAIIHPSTTGKSLSNQCCVYSPCSPHGFLFFSFFSEMKTHGEGCAIVRPGCHVFFFCFFIHSCIFPAVFVYFLFFTLTFFRIFDTIIPIYRGTNVCPFGHRVEKVKTWPFEPVG